MTIEESKNVQKRIFTYCTKHPDLARSGMIKGMDPETGKIVLQKSGVEKRVSIDILERDMFDFDRFDIKKEEKVEILNDVNSLDDMIIEEPTEELIESLDENVSDKIPTNLDEFNKCVASKNENLINKALETFAIDSTGKISISKAIEIVKENSVDNVVACIRDGKNLPTSLTEYDITGKCIGNKENSESVEINDLIDLSFNNVLIYIDAAKLKNVNFTDDQIKNDKTEYIKRVKNKINFLGLNRQNDENKVIDLETKKQEKEMSLQLRPDKDIRKAGFADIIILTIIVLVYAVIIINLIMKIK